LSIGDNVSLGFDCIIQAGEGITIDDFTFIGPGVKIWSQNQCFDEPDVMIRYSCYKYREVRIGKDVWIGANAFILPGAKVEDGRVIETYSVVGKKAWPKNSIISGNPARKIGERVKFSAKKQS